MVHYKDGLIITGGHPVRTTQITNTPEGGTDITHRWTLPRNHTQPIPTECDYIYNLQVKGSVAFKVHNTMCLALGSGQEEEGADPTYYGSQDVIRDLQSAPGYSMDIVELATEGPERCLVTGKVKHLKFKKWYPIGPNTYQANAQNTTTRTSATHDTHYQHTPSDDNNLDLDEDDTITTSPRDPQQNNPDTGTRQPTSPDNDTREHDGDTPRQDDSQHHHSDRE
eukprot:5862495-Heterocapsa_arctica.AAC.1